MARKKLGHQVSSLLSRAAHWATSPGPPVTDDVRATRDGRVLAGLLSPEQRSRYAETRDRRATAAFLTRERAAVLAGRDNLEATGEEREMLAVPWQPAETSSWLRDTFRGMTVVCGLGFLVGLFFGEAGMAIALLLGLLGAVTVTAERLVSAAQDRARVAPLLDWATTRPGQLGRGVPGSAPRSTVTGSLRPLLFTVQFVLVVPVVVGAFLLVIVGLLMLLFWAVTGSAAGAFEATFILALAAAVVVPIVVGVLILLVWRMGTLAEWHRASALEWLVPGPEPDPPVGQSTDGGPDHPSGEDLNP